MELLTPMSNLGRGPPQASLETLLQAGRLSLRNSLWVASCLAELLESQHSTQGVYGCLQPAAVLLGADVSNVRLLPSDGRPLFNERDWPYLSPEQTGRLSQGVDERS